MTEAFNGAYSLVTMLGFLICLFCIYYIKNEVIKMRLGELRTVTREMDNKLIVKVANYDTTKGVEIFDVAFDISNDNELYLRIIKGDLE